MSSRNRSPRNDGPRRQRRSVPPLLESLEDRLVLSLVNPSVQSDIGLYTLASGSTVRIQENGVGLAGGGSISAEPTLPDSGVILGGTPVKSPFASSGPGQQTVGPTGYIPSQILSAYGVNLVSFGGIKGDGAGQTIGIFEEGNNPAFVDTSSPNYSTSALAVFDKTFGIPDPPSLTFYTANGQPVSATNPAPGDYGAGVEIALDIEWVHAMAPAASIDVVETIPNAAEYYIDIEQGMATLASLPNVGVVSVSYGVYLDFYGQESLERQDDATILEPAVQANTHVTFFVSSGDSGAAFGTAYPSASPEAVAVGGTDLYLNSANQWQSETGWAGGGGGFSQAFDTPAFQESDGFNSKGARTTPDVAADADPATGVAVYDPYDLGTATPWIQVGGTSVAAPLWSGMAAIADQGRVIAGGQDLGAVQTQNALYELPATDFHDITEGDNGYKAGPGYDLVTGRGSPQANLLLPVLADYGLASMAAIAVEPPESMIAGGIFGTVIEAEDPGGEVDPGFGGTATLSMVSGPAGVTFNPITVDVNEGVAVFDGLSLSQLSDGTDYQFQITLSDLPKITTTTTAVDVATAASPHIGVYYPLPIDVSLRRDISLADADSVNATDDLYFVYPQAYALSAGTLILENTSTLAKKTLAFISDDETEATAPVINAAQSGRLFEIEGTTSNLSVAFEGGNQGLVVEGGLAHNDGGLGIAGASAVGGAFLIDGGVVALTNVTLQDNKAVGTTGSQGSVGASRTAGPGGAGANGGNSQGGAIYIAAGTLTLDNDTISGNTAQGGLGGTGGTGGLAGTQYTFSDSSTLYNYYELKDTTGGVGGTGGQGGIGAGGGLYIAGGNVSITGGNLASNKAVGGAGGNGGVGGTGGFPPYPGGTGGVGGVGGIGEGGGVYLGGGSLQLLDLAQIDDNSAAGGAGGKGGTGGVGWQSYYNTSIYGHGGDGGAGGVGNNGYGGGMYVSSGTLTWSAGSTLDSNTADGGISGTGGAGGLVREGVVGRYYDVPSALAPVAASLPTGTPGSTPANTAEGFGGGLDAAGIFTLTGASIEHNSAAYGGGIDVKGTLTLTGATLEGNIAVDDGGAVYSTGTLTVNGGTISGNSASASGGTAGLGGGIYASGKLTVTGATLSGNVAKGADSFGGGIYSPIKTTLTTTDDVFDGNSAVGGGGAIAGAGTLGVSSDSFLLNASDNGGAIFSDPGNLTISGSTTFDQNTASSDGGAIYNGGGTVTISGVTTFTDNVAGGDGGAIYGRETTKNSLSISAGSFLDNRAANDGGAIYSNGALTLSGSTLSANTAGQFGGGLYDVGTALVDNDTLITGNDALDGAGIFNGGKLTLAGADITSNAASDDGGGLYNSSGTVAITGGTINLNRAATSGGGVYVGAGKLTISALTVIEQNQAESGGGVFNAGGVLSLTNAFVYSNTAADGGGIMNSGNMTISIVTFAGNSAADDGGGIYNEGTEGTGTISDVTFGPDSALGLSGDIAGSEGGGIENYGTLTITNTTVARDTAGQSGGGIFSSASELQSYPGVLTLVNVTIADNAGGGLYINSGSTSLYNTIVAENENGIGADDISTPSDSVTVATNSENNLIGMGGSGGLTNGTSGNQTGVDNVVAALGALGNYGGPTETIPLLAGSTAIDAGANTIAGVTVPTTDERGALRGPTGRNAGLHVDIGAFEASSSYLVTTTVDSLAYGTLRSAVAWANASFNDNPENLGPLPAANTIVFDTANVFSTARTINLTLGTLDFTNTSTGEAIDGDGANLLTISAVNAGGAFSSGSGVLSIASDVVAEISGVTLSNGLAEEGGGIYNAGTLTVDGGAVISDNHAFIGGGIFNEGGDVRITGGAAVSSNSASWGGGISDSGGNLTITDARVSNNEATADGGGIYVESGSLTLNGATIGNNTAAASGGGIFNFGGTVKVLGGSLTGNLVEGTGSYSGGGAIYDSVPFGSGGHVTVTDSTISGNSAVNDGAGIFLNGGVLTLTDSTVSDGSAGLYGGAIFAAGAATSTVVGSTVSSNLATSGGGIFNGGTLSLANSTIALNTAVTGGGIDNAATLTALNVTIADNVASVGGGVYLESGTATLFNTIVALNTRGTAASDIGAAPGVIVSAASSFNLIGTGGSGGLSSSDNQLGVSASNVALGPLANNGGPTETIALLSGSLAIDRGSDSFTDGPTVPGVDQRGAVRGPNGVNAGSTVDIGAYEASSSYVVSTLTDSTAVGTLRSAAGWANISSNANPAETTNPEPNTIVFGVSGTFTLSEGPLALTNTNLQEAIDGAGETISGGGVSGVLTVASNVNVVLEGTSSAPLSITGGNAAGDGGGIDNSGNLTLKNVVVDGNTASIGGGLANEFGATLSLTDSILSDNSAGIGGGLANLGVVTLNDDSVGAYTGNSLSLSGNTAGTGGGIWNGVTGTLAIIGPNDSLGGDTTISGNTANVGDGGGIDNFGAITISDSTLFGNTAALAGGGIADETGASVTATNITLSNNAAADGGGIATAGTVVLVNATVAYNNVSALGTGGGLAVITGGVDTIYNTIVAKNTESTSTLTSTASDIGLVGTGIISPLSSFNLIGTGGAGNMVNGDNNNETGVASPGLSSGLANNGGPTETIALLGQSPALDAGSATIAGVSVPTTDQRGALRGSAGLNAGNAPDIGAFEDSSSYLVTTTANGPDLGTIETAVGWANVNLNVNPVETTSPEPNTIVFDSAGVFSTPQTITVTAPLDFSNTVTKEAIDGTTSSQVLLSGGNISGVLEIAGANVTITGLTIVSGSAAQGGAIDNSGVLTIDDSTVSDNQATDGGAIFNESDGTLAVQGSTLSYNSASDGGAIDNAGTAILTNVTIADNSSIVGGGISNGGTLVVINSTIANNTAITGGGLATGSGTAALYNTIVARNYSGLAITVNDISGDVLLTALENLPASSNNLVDDVNSAGGMVNRVDGNVIGSDAGFATGDLAYNGGNTETLALAAGSAAVDAGAGSILSLGVNIVPQNDQRGAARANSVVASARVDIGAYEISSSYLVTSTLDTLASGTLRTALAWANSPSGLSAPNTIIFDTLGPDAVFATPQTIALSSAFGALDLTNTNNGISIIGPGTAILTIEGDGDDGVFSIASGVTATITGMTITGGSAADGGAIVNQGTLTIGSTTPGNSDVDLTGNSALFYGGAIYNDGGSLTVNNAAFTDNVAANGRGGSIDNTAKGIATISNSVFAGGIAFQGGAIDNDGGTLAIYTSTLESNSGDEGGAIFNSGQATITSSTIGDDDTSFDGGGIANDVDGSLIITDSTIAFNTSGQTGGGINSVGSLIAINSTVADNGVIAGGVGGGIDASAGNATLYNTIVADNTMGTGVTAAASDVSGTIGVASAYNLIGTGGSGGLINGTGGNQVGVASPGLATNLANNGGPTPTLALLYGSPAIDAGNNALAVNAQGNPLTYDQRGPGYPRIVDGIVDIGAYEQAAATTIIVTSSLNPSIVGESVTLTAKLSAKTTSTYIPTGTVTFVSGTLFLGTEPLVNGTATVSTNALPVGADPIVVTYSGDSHFAGGAVTTFTQTVNALSTTSAAVPATLSGSPTFAVSAITIASISPVSSGSTATTGTSTQVVKKVVSSRKSLPNGGSAKKFHHNKHSDNLKRSTAAASKHARPKSHKK